MSIVFKTRTQLVVEAIREKILSGAIKAGEPLRQAALAEELNVSRIPVREALVQLEGEGLVSFEPHKGATASELSVEQVEELFELRALLECTVLAESLKHITDQQLTKADDILSQLEEALGEEGSSNTWSELNSEFHNCLYSAANRPQTQDIINILNKNADRYIRMHLLWLGKIDKAEVQHREILQSCVQRDVKKAVKLMKAHILESGEEIKEFLLQRENSEQ
ncbi:GntR family transcriptional regulator [Thalassotalea sp. 42_200_T64]|nr:GntR family transcriptional regulator [Thalassotalea sp. 42_200_T64]